MNRPGTVPVAKTRPAPDEDEPRKTVLLQVRLSEELRDKAALEAGRMAVSLSDFVRMAMLREIARLERERES